MGDAGSAIVIVVESPRGADAAALMTELVDDMRARYPPSSIHGVDVAALEAAGMFLVARVGGRPVGCGALRPIADGVAEVKRMYVRPEARRRGVARRVLVRLEAIARDRGFTTLRLESGTRQPESLALYVSAGYHQIPCFGEYATDPYSACFEKRLGGSEA
jgi:GNAT superfamily N-acetyltransferase